jgi:hypothetical protein
VADFGGFDITTPEEVQASQNAVRQKAALSGNAQVMRSSNIESALDTIFGNPQLNLARKVADKLKSAQSAAGAEQNPGETDLDYSIRKLAAQRDAVASIDPAAAAQMNTQLLKYGEMKFQRDILTQQNSRANAAEGRAAEEFSIEKPVKQAQANVAKINGGTTYVINTKSPLGTLDAKAFDLQDPTQTTEFTKAAAAPNTIVVSPTQAAELYKSANADATRLREAMAKAQGGVGKNTWNDVEKQGHGLVTLYDTVDRIFNVFEQNPDALSAASRGAKELDKLNSQLSSAARVVNGSTTATGTNIDTWMKANGVTNSRLQGLVIGTAFAIAQAQNGTGRITDRDLQAAKETIGSDNPNPAVMLSNLHDILTSQTGAMNDRIGYLDSDGTAPTFVKAMKQAIGSKQAAYDQKWSKYTGGRYQPAAGGPAATQDAGWITLPNGIKVRPKQ